MTLDLFVTLRECYHGQTYTLNGETYEGLTWYEENTLPKPTLEEIEEKWNEYVAAQPLKELRQERNKRLAACDWVTLKAYSTDTPIPEEWKAYMQALRDLPANTEDPANPVWPTAPTS
jgi:glutamate-1-semialdehyde aminotransferase